MNATTEKLLEAVFSMWFTLRLYTGDRNGSAVNDEWLAVKIVSESADTVTRRTMARSCGHEELV
jgi:hypothetical protein